MIITNERMTKSVVEQCDSPTGMTSELEYLADTLQALSNYVRLRAAGQALHENGHPEEGNRKHEEAHALLKLIVGKY